MSVLVMASIFIVGVVGPLLGFAAGYWCCMKQVRERFERGK